MMNELNDKDLENVTGGAEIPLGLKWKQSKNNKVSVVSDNCGMTITSNGTVTKLGYYYLNGTATPAVFITADRDNLSAWFADQTGKSFNYIKRLSDTIVIEVA